MYHKTVARSIDVRENPKNCDDYNFSSYEIVVLDTTGQFKNQKKNLLYLLLFHSFKFSLPSAVPTTGAWYFFPSCDSSER